MDDRLSVIPRSWFSARAYARPVMIGEKYREPRDGERALGRFIIPHFQRQPVWTQVQKVRLIESIWMGLPIGSYVVNVCYDAPTDGWLLDGQQRWSAIVEYFSDKFPVYGFLWSELPRRDQRRFEMSPFSELQTTLTTEDECRDVYERLAYGGTAHA